MRFHVTILLSGKTAPGIRVPREVVDSPGSHLSRRESVCCEMAGSKQVR